MEYQDRSGIALTELLADRLEGTELQGVYFDEDDEGRPFLGLVLSDGEKEYHLTFDGTGTVELAEGPLEGESLDEVTAFQIDEVEPPFSEDSSSVD